MDNIILLLITVLGSGALTTFIVSIFNKQKTTAETHNITLTGEVSIGTLAKDIAIDLRIELRAIRDDMKALEAELHNTNDNNRRLSKRLTELENDNITLMTRVTVLEKENEGLKAKNKELKKQLKK